MSEPSLPEWYGALPRFSFGDEARYRLAGIGLSNFVGEEESEPSLFEQNAECRTQSAE